MKYFNDGGTEFNPDLLPTPDLCATCRKADDPSQEMACNLNRASQHGEDVFVCFGYQPDSQNIDRKAVLSKLCQQGEVACTEEDNHEKIVVKPVDLNAMEYDERDWDAMYDRVRKILGDEDDWDENKSPKLYADHLRKHLQLPCKVTGIEDFRWEEYYIFGPGSKQKYAELKKKQPSYKDTFELLAIDPEWGSEWAMHYGEDIGAHVRRISDGREFTLGLSEIKTTDKSDANHQLLDDYAVWFVNSL